MRALLIAVTVGLLGATTAAAQIPDSTRARARADSIARARADSIRLVRELEALGRQDTTRPALPGQVRPTGSTNPRLLPDISAVGDLVADFSPQGSTQEDGGRFNVREIELALQAAVDPYFRGDIFLGISDLEGIAIEQAFLTATALPGRLEGRLGRYLMPIGKQNTTHRHDLHTVEYPYVLQRFLGEEGLKGTGLYLARVVSPLGFYQEIILTAVDRFGEAPEDLVTAEPSNHKLSGLGYSARLRNYWDLSQATNIELSASAMTGRREQPLATAVGDVNAALARQSLVGADFTFRWRPLQQGLYKSFLFQTEFFRQLNSDRPVLPAGVLPADYLGPTRNFSGAYVFARYQLTRRGYFGGRFDWVQDPEADGARLLAGTALYEFFPSEFSKLLAAVERRSLKDAGSTTRFLLQASFALGPHKPHPF
ncbi:MAG TPA: hypothetical protein VGQ69_05840 [Gemmatimonadales bacterium]|jgi:hypothetical protein|nr:hypothetical protein [Gemmatimonadales bacterium]HEV8598860.1 hypothetical protein [Gemmatimonadales bacterium]